MTFAEAMRRFGSDKPDLRNPLELVDVADWSKTSSLKSSPARPTTLKAAWRRSAYRAAHS